MVPVVWVKRLKISNQTFLSCYSQYVETFFLKLVVVLLFFVYDATSFGTITMVWWESLYKSIKATKK
jgi:hypothetical protein